MKVGAPVVKQKCVNLNNFVHELFKLWVWTKYEQNVYFCGIKWKWFYKTRLLFLKKKFLKIRTFYIVIHTFSRAKKVWTISVKVGNNCCSIKPYASSLLIVDLPLVDQPWVWPAGADDLAWRDHSSWTTDPKYLDQVGK